MTCIFDNCERPVQARKVCNRHYLQLKRHGKLEEFETERRMRMGRQKGQAYKRTLEVPNRDFQKSSGWMEHDTDVEDSQRYKDATGIVEKIVERSLNGDEKAKLTLGSIYREAVKVNEFASRTLLPILKSLEVDGVIVVEEEGPITKIRLMTRAEKKRRQEIREFVWKDGQSFSLAA